MSELRLPRKAKPTKVLSKDGLRPGLCHAWIAQSNGHRELIATNSFAIARLPVQEDVPLGPVPAEALARIERGHKHVIGEDGTVTFAVAAEASVTYPSLAQLKFPMDPIPEFKGKETVSVGLNPALLKDLAEALGANHGLKLEFVLRDGEIALSAIRVLPLGSADGREGLLMPIRLNV